MKVWLRDNGLLLVNGLLFVVFLIGTALNGWAVENEGLAEHGRPAQSLIAYLGSGAFGEAVFENWESEFLQMGAYVVLTVFLFQRGSAESKPIGEPTQQDEDPRDAELTARTPGLVRVGRFALVLYENSLLILFTLLFVASFAMHALGGAQAYSQEQEQHGLPPVSPTEYLGTSRFWFESFQNWQSEFLVVAVLVIATVYLRQRGSSQSKPVAAPHEETGS